MEIWEPKPTGTFWVTPGLLRDTFNFTFKNRSSYKLPLMLVRLIKFDYSRHIFEKYSNTTFHGNPFSGSLVVLRGRIDERTDGWVTFLNFANPLF